MSNFDNTRAYLVGRKVTLEEKEQKAIQERTNFEAECFNLMIKLEDLMKAGLDHFDEELRKIRVSIDLHQSMLVSLDSNDIDIHDDAALAFRREVSNIETALHFMDTRVKQGFHETTKPKPVIEIVSTPKPIKPKVVDIKQEIDDIIRGENGMINLQLLADRTLAYLSEKAPFGAVTLSELVTWMETAYPILKTKWKDMNKGLQNVLAILKRNDSIVSAGKGAYRPAEVAK